MQKLRIWQRLILAATCAGLLAGAGLETAQAEPAGIDAVTGLWEVSQEFGERVTYSALEISSGAEGQLAATWNGQALEDVKFADGKLTFMRTVTFGDQENDIDFSATVAEGKIDGESTSDWGSFPFKAARVKPLSPAVGAWQLRFQLGEREITNRLTVSADAAGNLSAKITSEGATHTVSNVKFADGKLTFDRLTKVNDFEWETRFEGMVKDGMLTGSFKGEQGDIPVEVEPLGAAFAGEWQLSGDFQFGAPTRTLRVYPDLTGRYQLFDGLTPVEKLTVDGEQLSFELEAGFGENTFTLEFKGKLEGGELKGEISTPNGATAVTGKKTG